MKNYKITLIGAIFSGTLLLYSLVTGVDLFEQLIHILDRFETFEMDEFLIPMMIFFLFLLVDLVRRRRTEQVELEKLKIYRAMMASTHHILNNFINQMQLFKMTAEDTPGFDAEILALYEQTIDEATDQVIRLGSVAEIDETSIKASVAPGSSHRV